MCVTEVISLEGELNHIHIYNGKKRKSQTKTKENRKQKTEKTKKETMNTMETKIIRMRDYNLIWFVFGVLFFGFTYLEVPLMMHL